MYGQIKGQLKLTLAARDLPHSAKYVADCRPTAVQQHTSTLHECSRTCLGLGGIRVITYLRPKTSLLSMSMNSSGGL